MPAQRARSVLPRPVPPSQPSPASRSAQRCRVQLVSTPVATTRTAVCVNRLDRAVGGRDGPVRGWGREWGECFLLSSLARRRPAARGVRSAALTRLQGDKYRICSLCNDQTAFRMPEKRPLDCKVFAS